MNKDKFLEVMLNYGWIPIVMLWLIGLGLIIYVAIHFILKWW